MDEAEPQRRRHRRRSSSPQGRPPHTEASTPPRPAPDEPSADHRAADARNPPANGKKAPERRAPRGRNRPGREESSMRDLVGGGQSQLGVSRALRARDLNRPTDEDIAVAQAETVVVRRNWRPET